MSYESDVNAELHREWLLHPCTQALQRQLEYHSRVPQAAYIKSVDEVAQFNMQCAVASGVRSALSFMNLPPVPKSEKG